MLAEVHVIKFANKSSPAKTTQPKSSTNRRVR